MSSQIGARVVVSALGDDPLSAIEQYAALAEMAQPDPATLGAADVVVAVRSAAVGWVDLLMTSGQYQHVPQPPYTPGLEYAGTVAWAGPLAGGPPPADSPILASRGRAIDGSSSGPEARFEVGERVLVDPFLAGPRSAGAYRAYGGFATWAVAPASAVHRIPGGLSFDQACNLLGNYETAYHCLIARGRLAAGETVLIHGASGSTGLAAVQVAKLAGATVIATGRSPHKLEVVKQHGADHIVDASQPLRDAVKSLTGGRGVDVVYDGVGGAISVESLRCVRFGARYLIVGWAATPFVARGRGERGAPNANQLPTNLIMMKGLDVLGCPTVISTIENPALRAPRLAQVLAWAADGRIAPHVSHVFALADFAAAMRAKWHGEVIGGCVVHP